MIEQLTSKTKLTSFIERWADMLVEDWTHADSVALVEIKRRLAEPPAELPRLSKSITLHGTPDPDLNIPDRECYTALNIGGHSQAILIVTKMADGSPVPPYAQEVIDFLLSRGAVTKPACSRFAASDRQGYCANCDRLGTEHELSALPTVETSDPRCKHGKPMNDGYECLKCWHETPESEPGSNT